MTILLKREKFQVNGNYLTSLFNQKEIFRTKNQAVFLTQVILRRQKNVDAKVVQSISCWQKWNLRQQFSKNYIFPNIQIKGVVNILPP